MRELEGRNALVTGASKGLGVYIARALAAEGMNLILAARSAEELERVGDELRARGTRVLCIPTDLGDRASLNRLIERAESEGGGVDVLVNNAGIERTSTYDKISIEAIDQMIEVNLRAPMVLARALFAKMLERGRGHIVNISSIAGISFTPYGEPYCATKAGLVGFTRSFRATAEAESSPVGCSVICPGFIEDAGMWNDMSREHQLTAPPLLGSSSPTKVAGEVVRAVRRDVPEIIVSPRPIRPLLALLLFAPRFVIWLGNRMGGNQVFGSVAKGR